MTNSIKRNIVQVRLSDDDFDAFIHLKDELGAKNNADAIRTLLSDKELLSEHKNINANSEKYDDLADKADGLMWSASNMTKSLNQVAHAANSAQQADPANADTWSWIVHQLQAILPAAQSLDDAASATKEFCQKARG